jgi:hypothetical protein
VGETPPCDADSDDDGIGDGTEDADHDGIVDPGETDPANADTDGDGLWDGRELGYTTGLTDTDPELFMLYGADVDPSTTTDPTNPDTDGDLVPDGVEDANQNGRVDAGETDPNVFDAAVDSLGAGGAIMVAILLVALSIVFLKRHGHAIS